MPEIINVQMEEPLLFSALCNEREFCLQLLLILCQGGGEEKKRITPQVFLRPALSRAYVLDHRFIFLIP